MTRDELARRMAQEHDTAAGVTFRALLDEYAGRATYPGAPDNPTRGWVAKLVKAGNELLKQDSARPVYRLRPKAHRVYMDGVVVDIEVTGFNAVGETGRLICCSFLPLHSDEVKTISIRFDEHGDDRRVLAAIRDELSHYQLWIGHYVSGFDFNWLNTRLMFYRMESLPYAMYFDTCMAARGLSLKAGGNSLGNLIDVFGLDGVKTSIRQTSWSRVFSPIEAEFNDIMTDIVYHCEQDVIATRNLFDVLYPYALANTRNSPWKRTKFGSGVQLENAA